MAKSIPLRQAMAGRAVPEVKLVGDIVVLIAPCQFIFGRADCLRIGRRNANCRMFRCDPNKLYQYLQVVGDPLVDK